MPVDAGTETVEQAWGVKNVPLQHPGGKHCWQEHLAISLVLNPREQIRSFQTAQGKVEWGGKSIIGDGRVDQAWEGGRIGCSSVCQMLFPGLKAGHRAS